MENIEHRTSNIERRMVRCVRTLSALAAFAAGVLIVVFSFGAFAQQTNTLAGADPLDYNSYRIITERNIFNQNRTGRYVRTSRQTTRRQTRSVTESFSLVGTMSYPKGDFAFFDGTAGDYKKVLEPGKTIAGYTVKEITPQNVTLVGTNGAPVKMNIGAQMRHEENGWQLSQQNEAPAVTTNEGAEPATAPAESSGNSGMEMNDVLKKLMQQREQEDSK